LGLQAQSVDKCLRSKWLKIPRAVSRRLSKSVFELQKVWLKVLSYLSGGTLKTKYAWLAGTAVIVLVAPGNALRAGERDSPNDRISSAARQEIKSVEREVDRAEFESPTRAKSVTLARAQGRPFRKTTQ
jgi:hypothetical protein